MSAAAAGAAAVAGDGTAATGGAPAIADDAVAFLPRGVRVRRCEVRQAWFLLAPERAVKLDATAAHILGALDGERDFAAVVTHLAEAFDAPRERIETDARAFLTDLLNRRMVEVRR